MDTGSDNIKQRISDIFPRLLHMLTLNSMLASVQVWDNDYQLCPAAVVAFSQYSSVVYQLGSSFRLDEDVVKFSG